MRRAASVISVSTALVFPVLLVAALWPMGLTGLWLNFAATSLLAGILAAVVLRRFLRKMRERIWRQPVRRGGEENRYV